jgi:hypothetical protein
MNKKNDGYAGFGYVDGGVVATFDWKLRPHEGRQSKVTFTMLEDWHRAALLGLEIEELAIDGRPVGELQLEKLNMWLSTRAAWNYRNKPYWEARTVIMEVMFGMGADAKPRKGGYSDGAQPVMPVMARIKPAKKIPLAKKRTRKNERGPVSREDAARWMRDIDARRDSRG